MALALADAQVQAQRPAHPGFAPTLGWLYLTDALATDLGHDGLVGLLAETQARWPGVTWVGAAVTGLAVTGGEYHDEPALALMLADLPPGSFRLFHGRQPLDGQQRWAGALVHADPAMPDMDELVAELASRVGTESTECLFGGLVSHRAHRAQWAGDEVFNGGFSGVAFAPGVRLVSRYTQGAQPLGSACTITSADGPVVLTLDDEPALDVLLAEVGGGVLNAHQGPDPALLQRLRNTLAGLTQADEPVLDRGGRLSACTRVRPIIGVDPARRAVVMVEQVEAGMQLNFCQRDVPAERRDLVRICAEIREEVESSPDAAEDDGDQPAARILGAFYTSCHGRGGTHFGGPSAEMQLVRQALGDVPVIGFYAGGEISGPHLHGYGAVLTVLVGQPAHDPAG